jgi:hypothetical protein
MQDDAQKHLNVNCLLIKIIVVVVAVVVMFVIISIIIGGREGS